VIEDCERDLNVGIPFYDNFVLYEKQNDILIAEEAMVYSTASGSNSGARKMGLILSLIMAAVIASGAHLHKYLNGWHFARLANISASDLYYGFSPANDGIFGNIVDNASRHNTAQPEINGSVNDQPNQTRYRQSAELKKQTGSIIATDIADEVSPVNLSGDHPAEKERTQPVDSAGLNEKTPTVQIVRKPIEPNASANFGQQKTEAASSSSNKFSFKYPEIAELFLEKAGRPAPATKKVTVNFDHNSSELPAFEIEKLNIVVDLISHIPNAKIIIEGYTDSGGNYDFNKELSEFRARVIENYFIAVGIAPKKIQVLGRGSDNPIARNDTFEGRKRNRRVEITVKDET
jgi:outer membrane protein OmpA-like peptidoglycan-associated protein